MLTVEQFRAAVGCTKDAASRWHPQIVLAMQRWGINTPQRAAGFLAQMAMECAKFSKFEESFNYSSQGLANQWPKHFAVEPRSKVRVPNIAASRLGRGPTQGAQQRLIASLVYGNRYGNGAPETGDGWTYRGRGPKQITFKDNYRDCGDALGLDLVKTPDLLLSPENGAQAAGWYWSSRHCNDLMDAGDYLAVTKAINGGTNGHEDGNNWGNDDRVELWASAKAALGVA